MTQRSDLSIFTIGAAMEVCWLHAWIGFILFAIYRLPFPVTSTTAIFLAGAVATLPLNRGWRRIYVISVVAVFFLATCSLCIYGLRDHTLHLLGYTWHPRLGQVFSNPTEFFFLVVMLILITVAWRRGFVVGRTAVPHRTWVARFDLGLAAFLLLLVIKLVLKAKGQPNFEGLTDDYLFLPFTIFGLMALGVNRYREGNRRRGLTGLSKVAVLMSAGLFLLFFCIGVALLCYSQLAASAAVLSRELKQGAEPLVPALITVLLFLVSQRRRSNATGENTTGSEGLTASGATDPLAADQLAVGYWESLLLGGLGYIILLLLALGIGLALFFLGRLLWRYLWGRPQTVALPSVRLTFFSAWRQRMLKGLRYLQRWYQRLIGPTCGVEGYRRLVVWGRRTGLTCRRSETPTEYHQRLTRFFPELKSDIGTIVEAFQKEVYGETDPAPDQTRRVRRALKHLRRPTFWPKRIKTWFLSS